MANRTEPLNVFTITGKDGDDRSFWTKIGAAFVNSDGSINVVLEAFPANGRLHIRERGGDGNDEHGAAPERRPSHRAQRNGRS